MSIEFNSLSFRGLEKYKIRGYISVVRYTRSPRRHCLGDCLGVIRRRAKMAFADWSTIFYSRICMFVNYVDK